MSGRTLVADSSIMDLRASIRLAVGPNHQRKIPSHCFVGQKEPSNRMTRVRRTGGIILDKMHAENFFEFNQASWDQNQGTEGQYEEDK